MAETVKMVKFLDIDEEPELAENDIDYDTFPGSVP